MKFGIYFAFWEKEWKVSYEKYIKKAAGLGFDILEISCAPLPGLSDEELYRLRDIAKDHGIILTAGYGPTADQNLSSPDPAIVKNAKAYAGLPITAAVDEQMPAVRQGDQGAGALTHVNIAHPEFTLSGVQPQGGGEGEEQAAAQYSGHGAPQPAAGQQPKPQGDCYKIYYYFNGMWGDGPA